MRDKTSDFLIGFFIGLFAIYVVEKSTKKQYQDDWSTVLPPTWPGYMSPDNIGKL